MVVQPSDYALLLESKDEYEPNQLLIPTTFTMDGEMLVLIVSEPVHNRRLWNMLVLAYGCLHNAVMETTELSMFL